MRTLVALVLIFAAYGAVADKGHERAKELVSSWTYVSDPGTSDQWAKPKDSIKTLSGDCEDLVFLIWDELVKLGVDTSELQIMEGTIMLTGEYHLVLKYGNVIYDTTMAKEPQFAHHIRDSFMIARRWSPEFTAKVMESLQ